MDASQADRASLLFRALARTLAQAERDNESCFFVREAGVHRFIRHERDAGDLWRGGWTPVRMRKTVVFIVDNVMVQFFKDDSGFVVTSFLFAPLFTLGHEADEEDHETSPVTESTWESQRNSAVARNPDSLCEVWRIHAFF
ncbi:hypothetical protein EVAR_14498_1 [Eumeta japonica]|uniref:Uncharacterized protein n=1 Tax=Eumeta variegata TaxID=151549 RepID=A0A4C1U375_EUMVA|nr:hypothetical protein EVAR_14498_1 [Eumeta japonica]